MKHIVVITVIGATLAGCSNIGFGALKGSGQKAEAVVPVVDRAAATETSIVRPTARPGGVAVGVTASVAPENAAENGPLGTTVASLGNPAETGLWLKTPLVKEQQAGRVSYNGKTANVTLIPIEGAATAGSRMSLQTFQALGAPLTDLVTVTVAI